MSDRLLVLEEELKDAAAKCGFEMVLQEFPLSMAPSCYLCAVYDPNGDLTTQLMVRFKPLL